MRVTKNIEEQIIKIKATNSSGSSYYFYDPNDKIAFENKVEIYATKIINFEIIDQSLYLDLLNNYNFQYFIRDIILIKDTESKGIWFLEHPIANVIFNKSQIPAHLLQFVYQLTLQLFNNYDVNETEKLITFLNKKGFENNEIIECCAIYSFDFYNYQIENNIVKSKSLKGIGHFLLAPIKGGMFSFLKKEEKNYIPDLIQAFVNDKQYHYKQRIYIFSYVNEKDPNKLHGHFNDFFVFKDNNTGQPGIDFHILDYINKNYFKRFETNLAAALSNESIPVAHKYQIACCLNDNTNQSYLQQSQFISSQYINLKKKEIKSYNYAYFNIETFANNRENLLLVDIFQKLIKLNKKDACDTILDYANEVKFLQIPVLNCIENEYQNESLPILIAALNVNKILAEEDYYNNLFALIKKHEFINYKNEIVEFLDRTSNKKIKKTVCTALASLNENITPYAKELLAAKTIQQRTIGALILSQINDSEIKKLLTQTLNTEKNDDTRDIIIENLQEELYGKDFTIADCKNLIALALQRGKLSKLSDKFIDEEKIPNLFWLDKTALTIEEKRFLLYRMSRSKGLNSDIEARKIIQNIDKNTSGIFSKFLLAAFTDSDCNTKLKYYMTLSAMLGGDESVAALDTLFRKTIADKRVKLAEMVVAALAMVGTNKALLSVEVISRKFANKKPAISAAANAALEAAAEELSITKDELADRIIPNFEFDGIFKEFEVEGSTYRAFVNSDFTLCFIDEDNKMRKALPKNISKELKTEFADITKEIKNVSKSQTGRLEKYLVEDRKWAAEAWQTFFLHHPIMFVYAMKLLWIVYNENGNIKDVFQCQEDTSLVNYNEEEITLEETDIIDIYHPVHVAESVNTNWNNKLYYKNFVTVFPQTARKILTPLPDELDKSVSERFNKTEVPKGADFAKSFMEKSGWLKGTGDGGSVEFVKIFADIGLRVLPYIEGPTAWYQEGKEKAIIHQINFLGKNWDDKFLIKNVPPIIYSEVMANLQELIDAK